ncbi:M10 family metallopeptidase C-terminal domain-containing protein [Falsiroseomonas sp.]|uniref:M10 family metallopeptidase C-terminal domain-containing protein n=1 Tax=Falsiroseomonas sp. TaxID=2870721 RepID=UPI003F72CBFB
MCMICAGTGLRAEDQPAQHLAASLVAPPQRGWAFADYTGDATLDSLLLGSRWTGTSLSYALPADQAAWGDGFLAGLSEAALPPSESLARAMDLILTGQSEGAEGPLQRLTSLAAFTPLTLARSEDVAGATLRLGLADRLPEAFGLAFPPGNEAWGGGVGSVGPGVRGGDVWLSFANFMTGPGGVLDPVPGGLAWHTLTHELGHALGLAHPHQGPGQAGGTVVAMPDAWNSVEFTNMAYRLHPEGSVDDQSPIDGFDLPQSWMTYDIRALQHLYGANYATEAGDTVYRFDPLTGEVTVNGIGQGAPGANRILLTIWDGGGRDTYDLRAYADDLRIDLAPGAGSILSPAQLADLTPLGEEPGTWRAQRSLYNAFLYQDDPRSLIEDVWGGTGDDRISGNLAANRLAGAAGADTLLGLQGADTLDGGAGADRMEGGAGDDTYLVDQSGDRVVEQAAGGRDTVIAARGWQLGAHFEVLLLTEAAGAARGLGNAEANRIEGNGFDNTLVGGAGNDALSGHGGIDRLFGEADADLLSGGAGDDLLFGGAGDDVLLGGEGADRMAGGTGNDSYAIDQAGDRVLERAEEGQDTVISSLDVTRLDAALEELVLIDRALQGFGNALDNDISGSAMDNLLSGLGGDDTLSGGAGADRVLGGAGADSLVGGSGDDWLAGGVGDDSLEGGSGRDTLRGGEGADLLLGGAGDDRMAGDAGADTLLGEGGNDTLIGDAGNDVLVGGSGEVRLQGGAGADIFAWAGGSEGRLTIADFSLAEDRIGLAAYYDNFAVLAEDLSGIEGGTLLRMDNGNEVVIQGLALAEVSASLFLLAPPGSLMG